MKRIFVSPDLLIVGHLREVLERAGIACYVKNEHLTGGVGELPANEVWPELWVIDDELERRARNLAAALLADHAQSVAGEPWSCPRCGETLEPQFSACWRCDGADGSGTLLA